MLSALALSAAISSCAPGSDPILISKIIAHESGGEQFAVNDNTTKRTYLPKDQASAEALLVRLRGDSLDVGLMQVNVGNWPTLGITEANVFDPCTNIRGGALIFAYFYDQAVRHGLAGYNTGDIFSSVGAKYASLVLDRTVVLPRPSGAVRTPRPQPSADPDAAPSQPAGPLSAPSQLGPDRSSSF